MWHKNKSYFRLIAQRHKGLTKNGCKLSSAQFNKNFTLEFPFGKNQMTFICFACQLKHLKAHRDKNQQQCKQRNKSENRVH